MKGYVAERRGRFYAVIYEGLDPVTGRERRTWHPAGTGRAAAERLAARLAIEAQGRTDAVRALTFGAYLTGQWLPGKKLQLAASTYHGYERNVQLHILPALGRVGLTNARGSTRGQGSAASGATTPAPPGRRAVIRSPLRPAPHPER